LAIPIPLAHGPFLYLYTCQQTSDHRFNKKQLLHFIPLLLSYFLIADFFLLPVDQQAEIFRQQGHGYETQMLINITAISLSGIVYVVLSLMRLLRYRKKMVNQFSNTEKINFNWLLYLIIWVVAIWIIVLFAREDKLIYGTASLFVLWLGYFGIKQVQVFSHPSAKTSVESVSSSDDVMPYGPDRTEKDPGNIKYQKSTLTEEEAKQIHERLKQLLADQRPYTNPDLTLDELAKSLDVHPNTLSQVINSMEKKTFYDLINEKRVEAFIRNSSQPDNKQYTLLAIAYDCGFNSKASFNRNFKKYTGHTPSDYLKKSPVE
jgi:AraC-like DNA-binding protein